ncbi:MAG: DnaJ domain-containing protein, partial [Deltaproteobacteria bacterium]|nr:DnaJ domain-containing protein [Deltaproteobacteria bacterium]
MERRTEKNYYELLDITPGATNQEIEEAFRRAKTVYGEDSVALYSLYSSEERKTMMEGIGEAYETLKDPIKRNTYNTWLASSHQQKNQQDWDIPVIQDNKDIKETLEGTPKAGRLKVVMSDIDPLAAEQYRILYTKIEQIGFKNSYKTFAITSAVKGEGKTITSLNLAYVMAQEFKKRVILVECDLKNPSITSHFLDAGQVYGLADVIKGEVDLYEAVTQVDKSNLYFLPAIHAVKNSSELLSSSHMDALLNMLKTQ